MARGNPQRLSASSRECPASPQIPSVSQHVAERENVMLDSLDWLFDAVALIFLAVILTILIVGFVWLGSLPGNIARKRSHPNADAVTVLGWVGLLFVILWPIAFAWAFIRTPSNPAATMKEAGQ